MAGFKDILNVAVAAAKAHQQGKSSVYIKGTYFDLKTGGMCSRFIRQAIEAALGLSPFDWEYARGTARDTEKALRNAGMRLTAPVPGCIMALNNQSYWAGHIAIWVGDGTIAENTSSKYRGNPRKPGTKITPVSAVINELSGYYAPTEELLASVTLKIVLLPGSTIVDCDPHFDGFSVTVNRVDCLSELGLPDDPHFKPRVGIRALLESKGYEVISHIEVQRIYIKKK